MPRGTATPPPFGSTGCPFQASALMAASAITSAMTVPAAVRPRPNRYVTRIAGATIQSADAANTA